MTSNIEIGLLMMIIAMPISMAIIPLLAKYAYTIGMIDEPDPRKIHSKPIPRVGGPGIVLGALVPVSIWLSWDVLVTSYLAGSLVLLTFGVWDDIKQLGHYAKFIGQFTAVLLVVYYGGLYVTQIPFIGELNASIGKIFTVITMVGVINALNHSDGLDGLAGGESLMSLSAIAYLSYISNDMTIFLISLSTIGGVFGFLRFNSHPAHIFMGDGGSQFLGFTLAFLVIHLTQISNPTYSSSIAVLLIGLPIVDIVAVLFLRMHGGMNWFRATRNHVHHRLLEMGFHHYESVVIIYSVQVILVICAVVLPYESDGILLSIYTAVSALLFSFLIIAENKKLKIHVSNKNTSTPDLTKSKTITNRKIILKLTQSLIYILLSLFLIYTSINAVEVSKDFQFISGILFLLLTTRLILGYKVWFMYLRLLIYLTIALLTYLFNTIPKVYAPEPTLIYVFYAILFISVIIAMRYSKDNQFEFSPLDYLFLLAFIILIVISKNNYDNTVLISLAIQLVILFYASEIIIKHMKNRANVFTLSSLAALGIIFSKSIF